jgi:hypothetical protein
MFAYLRCREEHQLDHYQTLPCLSLQDCLETSSPAKDSHLQQYRYSGANGYESDGNREGEDCVSLGGDEDCWDE